MWEMFHLIGIRDCPSCELYKKERKTDQEMTGSIQDEILAHIQSASAGFASQRKSVIDPDNTCGKFLLDAIVKHGSAKRIFEVIGGDRERQLVTLWQKIKIGQILPWERVEKKAEKLLNLKEDLSDGEQKDKQVEQRDENDLHNNVIFGKQRRDSVVIHWAIEIIFVMEFKRV